MVVFTCNQCGDSLKKNKVEQHARICRCNSVTCMDCLKDFTLISYSNHIECVTEDQKYGGPNCVAQQFKGKNKQNEWIKRIKTLIQQNQYPKEISSVLNQLINYENIPRKRAKFVNFVKNSFRIRDEKFINQIWSIFETSLKQEKSENNGSMSVKKHIAVKDEDVTSVAEENQLESNASIEPDQNAESMNTIKIKMKRTIIDIVDKHEQIPLKKLRKKVLKTYHANGFDDDERTLNKFEKCISKKRFLNHNDMITLA